MRSSLGQHPSTEVLACACSVSIAHGAPDFLRPVAILEAGSVPTLRLLPGIPNREGSATWQAYATSTVITGKTHDSKCAPRNRRARDIRAVQVATAHMPHVQSDFTTLAVTGATICEPVQCLR